ncbi:MAG TPA: hypothetical protein VFO76_02945 [Candidatus Kapabacteria bacterium]|nr:hypothetical protein [Candidatus Kapabacteria bacterium]
MDTPIIKEEAKQLIDQLPEEATLDDIEYHLYVRQKIERSQNVVEGGKFITHEDALKQFREWGGK